MLFGYEKLEVTKDIHLLISHIYRLTSHWPKEEQFGLISQARRSATSVLLNLAEGSARQRYGEFSHFLRISIGSLVELDAIMKIAIQQKFVLPVDIETIEPFFESIYFKLVALEKRLPNKSR